jgi:hypothetical protein
LDEEYRSLSSSLCSFLHTPVTTSVFTYITCQIQVYILFSTFLR